MYFKIFSVKCYYCRVATPRKNETSFHFCGDWAITKNFKNIFFFAFECNFFNPYVIARSGIGNTILSHCGLLSIFCRGLIGCIRCIYRGYSVFNASVILAWGWWRGNALHFRRLLVYTSRKHISCDWAKTSSLFSMFLCIFDAMMGRVAHHS